MVNGRLIHRSGTRMPLICRLPRKSWWLRILWGKTPFRVNDSLKAGAADFAVAVNHIAGTGFAAGWSGRAGREKRRRPMWQALFADWGLAVRGIVVFLLVILLMAGVFYGLRRFRGPAPRAPSSTPGPPPRH